MPRAFLIKKHSPGKENTAKTKPDQFDPDGHDHMDTQADSDTLNVATKESSRGPFDLTTKASKAEDEPEPAKTTPCTPGVIEFSPKIVPTPNYNAQIIPPKPSVLVPSVTRPTPSHIQKPVPRIYPQPYMSPYGYSSLMHPPPYTFPYTVYKNGWLQPIEGVPCSTLYPAAGHWGPREGTPSPDSRQSLLESAGGKPLVSSSSHPPRYECQECSKSYATYSGLARHKQFHCLTQDKKSFNCKYCDKVYVSLGALKMHIRTHTLPCKCTLCGKAFSRPWLLQGHIRTHTGEKPFACPHCNRAFADRSNLRAHLQTHSEIKKYNCQSCSKTFSRMSLLSKHTDGGCNTIRYGPVAIQNC